MTSPQPVNLSNDAFRTLIIEDAHTQVIDVRTPDEYAYLGHIAGARLLPLQMLPQSLESLNPNLKTVAICQHGVRSQDAAWFLIQHGFTQVYQLAEGMAAWDGGLVYETESKELTS